jgi:tripartite ATP-independent transporter DctM subunit
LFAENALQTFFGARTDGIVKRVASQVAFFGVLGMIAVSLLTAFDIVVMRWLINKPIPGSNEFLSTIFAVSVSAVLPGVLANRAGLEVDILAGQLQPAVVSFLRRSGQALLLVLIVLIAWRVAEYAHQAYDRGQSTIILQWRTWPFLALIALVFVFCIPVQYFTFLGTFEDDEGYRNSLSRAAASIALPAALVLVILFLGDELKTFFSSHPIILSLAMFALMWVLVLLLIPVAVVLLTCGFIGTVLLLGSYPALNVLGSETAGLLTNTDLAVVPFFLLMGGFATAGGLSNDIYRLAHASFGFLRGGLAHATVGGCAGFGALTGSSLATVATMGRVALPEMRERGYAASLSSGCIVAGGTLGQLVPPSTAIVVYALLTEESIGELYIAVLIPALITVILYMAAITINVHLNPDIAPSKDRFDPREFFAALRNASVVVGMFALVIGGIYGGIFTATEAAAIGAAIAFFAALFRGKLRKDTILSVATETTTAAGIVYFVIIGAFITTFFIGTAGLPAYLTETLVNSGLAPLAIILLLVVFYIVLGCAMDSFTVMIITAPLVAVMITKIGYDLTWWGIMMVVLVELGVVTPPFGMNLFVMKTVDPTVPLKTIFAGTVPFVIADLIKIVLLIAFPWLVLWLPQTAFH